MKGRENLAATNEARAAKADAVADRLGDQIAAYQQLGYSQRRIVEALNRVGVTIPGGQWCLKQVHLLLRRIETRAPGHLYGTAMTFWDAALAC